MTNRGALLPEMKTSPGEIGIVHFDAWVGNPEDIFVAEQSLKILFLKNVGIRNKCKMKVKSISRSSSSGIVCQ